MIDGKVCCPSPLGWNIIRVFGYNGYAADNRYALKGADPFHRLNVVIPVTDTVPTVQSYLFVRFGCGLGFCQNLARKEQPLAFPLIFRTAGHSQTRSYHSFTTSCCAAVLLTPTAVPSHRVARRLQFRADVVAAIRAGRYLRSSDNRMQACAFVISFFKSPAFADSILLKRSGLLRDLLNNPAVFEECVLG